MHQTHNSTYIEPDTPLSFYLNEPRADHLTIEATGTPERGLRSSFMRDYSIYQASLQSSSIYEGPMQDQFIQGSSYKAMIFMEENPQHFTLQDVFKDSLFTRNDKDIKPFGVESLSFKYFGGLNPAISDKSSGSVSPDITSAPYSISDIMEPGQSSKKKRHKRRSLSNRSRSGCWICRIKHLKCDESKPACQNCIQFGIKCDYSKERPAYVSDSVQRRLKLDTIVKKKRRRTDIVSSDQFAPSVERGSEEAGSCCVEQQNCLDVPFCQG